MMNRKNRKPISRAATPATRNNSFAFTTSTANTTNLPGQNHLVAPFSSTTSAFGQATTRTLLFPSTQPETTNLFQTNTNTGFSMPVSTQTSFGLQQQAGVGTTSSGVTYPHRFGQIVPSKPTCFLYEEQKSKPKTEFETTTSQTSFIFCNTIQTTGQVGATPKSKSFGSTEPFIFKATHSTGCGARGGPSGQANVQLVQSTILYLPDNVLTNQVCHSCHKYLSVTPIKVYLNRKIKCGRCVLKDNDDEGNGVVSMFNQLAKRSLFKCINRFDGCTELLKSSDVVKHEETCLPKKYTCPLCSEEVFTFLLVLHFEQNHVGAFLKLPFFKVNNLAHLRKYFLYMSDDNLFFVYFSDVTKNFPDNDLRDFSLNVLYLGKKGYVKGIKAEFDHFDGYTNTTISVESIISSCQINLHVTNNNGFLVVTFDIDLEHQNRNIFKIMAPIKYLEKENSSATSAYFSLGKIDKGVTVDFAGDKMKLLCVRKRDIFANNDILMDGISHLSISEATITFKKYNQMYTVTLACDVCDLIYPWFYLLRDTEILYLVAIFQKYSLRCRNCRFSFSRDTKTRYILTSKEFSNISFFCAWDCGEAHNYEQLYVHERKCEKQLLQKCPIKTCFDGFKLTELNKHFVNSHPSVIFQILDYNERVYRVALCPSKSPIEHILLYWCICVHVQLKWEKPYWKINFSCKIPEVEVKAKISDENDVSLGLFINSGVIRHHDLINIYLRMINNENKSILDIIGM